MFNALPQLCRPILRGYRGKYPACYFVIVKCNGRMYMFCFCLYYTCYINSIQQTFVQLIYRKRLIKWIITHYLLSSWNYVYMLKYWSYYKNCFQFAIRVSSGTTHGQKYLRLILVRRGSVLSPLMFALYVDEWSRQIVWIVPWLLYHTVCWWHPTNSPNCHATGKLIAHMWTVRNGH